jgi:hypothetical protein
MLRTAVRLVAGSFLTLGLALGIAQGAGAQDTGTSLTVHQRLCGDNYQGGDPFTECHDVVVGQSFDFTIDGPVTQTKATDAASGNVEFASIPAGTYNLYGGIPGEFSTKNFYCSDSVTGNAVNVTPNSMGADVEVPDGVAVVCDVYEFPEDLSGNTPTPAPSATATVTSTPTPKATGTVTTLPSTGTGANGSGSDEAMWLVIPGALALGGLAYGLRRRSLNS